MERFKSFAAGLGARARGHENGSSIVEYILLVVLIAVVCLLTLNALGITTADKVSHMAVSLRQS